MMNLVKAPDMRPMKVPIPGLLCRGCLTEEETSAINARPAWQGCQRVPRF